MGLLKYIKNHIWHDRNTRSSLDQAQHKLNRIQSVLDEMVSQNRMDYLRDKTLNSHESGISDEKCCESELVVSLTTFGKRIYDVYLAIESIMQGSIKPNRIILWLSEEEFKGKPLPRTLELQRKRGLQVEYCEDIRSYKKLIPTLKLYPDSCIVTIDDDVMCEFDVVERLLNSHLNHPNAVCACRMHEVKLDENGRLKGYLDWNWDIVKCDKASSLLFPTGVGGVLYPPHCLPDEVLNEKVFMSICPYADDVWLYAMELMHGTPAVKTYTGKKYYFVDIPSYAINSLSAQNTNAANCRNDVQIKAVFDKYQLYSKLTDASER